MMGSAAFLCAVSLLEAAAGIALDNDSIRTAVAAWISDSTAAEAAYGHISTWETGEVTDMGGLFKDASSFNEDIGAWDTSGVTSMSHMFYGASAFNRDIGDWAVHSVTDMSVMFHEASAFDQDLGAWDTSGVTTMNRMFWGASSFNQNIGGWQVGNVNEMGYMFKDASAFNQDISAWAVNSVTDMEAMFWGASALNQDISGWAVHSVKDMSFMFHSASVFDQDLGWCVDDDVNLYYAFSGTPCEATSCGVPPEICDYPMTDSTIRTAVEAWLSNPTAAEAAYGHISTWATGEVTDMSTLFCAYEWGTTNCNTNTTAASFNENIGAWDTSSVTSMSYMFQVASSFNQDLSDWAVHSVRTMNAMFYHAYSFDQDLGWCVNDNVNLDYAFRYSLCDATSCGVVRCPTKENDKEIPVAIIAGVAAGAALLLAIGAFYYYHRRKASTTDKADEPSGANPEPTELSPPEEATSPKEATGPESLETRAAVKANAAESVERPGFTRKLSSFLFGEQEEESTAPTVAEAEEAPSAEQPPPPPMRRTEPEPAAPKAGEMYNQIAAWYNAPENAALRATWGAYPESDEFQTWPGFVAVTNAYLDREAG